MPTAKDVLRVAAAEVGYHRHDDPKNGTKYGRWYAELTSSPYFGTNGVPYCAMFVSWVLAKAGQKCAGFPTASCTAAKNGAGNAGIVLSNKRDAKPGDIVIFDWDPANGNGVDHVGFVELNRGSHIQTIEGNTSSGAAGSQGNGGGVYRRTRDWSVVSCVIRPPYTGASKPSKPNGGKPSKDAVDVDGYIGPESWKEMQGQLGCKAIDGVMSGQPKTVKPHIPNVRCAEWGSAGSIAVERLQKFLRAKGYGIEADGYCGPATVKALQRFMRDDLGYKKHAVDGVLGFYTACNVQNALNAGAFEK